MKSPFLACVLACAASAACGEVKGNSPDGGGSQDVQGDFTLTVDPTAVTIPIASSDTLTVTVARTGTVGDITLSATGLGANLTATFSPEVLPEGTNTSEVTITVQGGTAAGTSMVAITGTAGDKTQSAEVAVTSTTITVNGTVRGSRSGVQVGLVGKQTVTTGAGGVFTFTDVTPPYDLYTVANSGCAATNIPTVYYYDDLTRTDPTVTAATHATTCPSKPPISNCIILNNCPTAGISGTKSGAGNNNDEVIWLWTGGSIGLTLNSNGTYSGSAGWSSGTTNTGYLYALQLTRKTNGAPDTFLGYVRSAETTLTNGQSSTINLNFATVNSTATVTGTLNGPAGYPTPGVSLYQEFGASAKLLWSADTTAIDATFPLIAQAGGNSLYASTTLDGGASFYVLPLTGNATLDFTMPAAAVLSTPEASATGVTANTDFAWTAPSDVISELRVSGGATGGVYHIFTKTSQMKIPQVPELPLASGATYNWRVYGYAPVSSINDAAATNELETVSALDISGPPHAYTYSANRSFTTP